MRTQSLIIRLDVINRRIAKALCGRVVRNEQLWCPCVGGSWCGNLGQQDATGARGNREGLTNAHKHIRAALCGGGAIDTNARGKHQTARAELLIPNDISLLTLAKRTVTVCTLYRGPITATRVSTVSAAICQPVGSAKNRS